MRPVWKRWAPVAVGMGYSTADGGRPVPASPLWYCADAWLRLGYACGHTITAQVRTKAGSALRDTALSRIVDRLGAAGAAPSRRA